MANRWFSRVSADGIILSAIEFNCSNRWFMISVAILYSSSEILVLLFNFEYCLAFLSDSICLWKNDLLKYKYSADFLVSETNDFSKSISSSFSSTSSPFSNLEVTASRIERLLGFKKCSEIALAIIWDFSSCVMAGAIILPFSSFEIDLFTIGVFSKL